MNLAPLSNADASLFCTRQLFSRVQRHPLKPEHLNPVSSRPRLTAHPPSATPSTSIPSLRACPPIAPSSVSAGLTHNRRCSRIAQLRGLGVYVLRSYVHVLGVWMWAWRRKRGTKTGLSGSAVCEGGSMLRGSRGGLGEKAGLPKCILRDDARWVGGKSVLGSLSVWGWGLVCGRPCRSNVALVRDLYSYVKISGSMVGID
ncbi:hypothetical protein OF83DRAFT_1088273 [Amylostereum chailletii]|nr:hypothetical protein OF83DRAFT_1088273 [Amylostereum chailletii]